MLLDLPYLFFFFRFLPIFFAVIVFEMLKFPHFHVVEVTSFKEISLFLLYPETLVEDTLSEYTPVVEDTLFDDNSVEKHFDILTDESLEDNLEKPVVEETSDEDKTIDAIFQI